MITQEQLENIWTQANGDWETACRLLEELVKASPDTHWEERHRCRRILAAMRDAE